MPTDMEKASLQIDILIDFTWRVVGLANFTIIPRWKNAHLVAARFDLETGCPSLNQTKIRTSQASN